MKRKRKSRRKVAVDGETPSGQISNCRQGEKMGKGGEIEIGERLREGLGLTPRGRIWNCEEGLNSVEEREMYTGRGVRGEERINVERSSAA